MEKNEKLLFAKMIFDIGLLLFGILLNTFTPFCYLGTVPLGVITIFIMIKNYRQLRKLYIDED